MPVAGFDRIRDTAGRGICLQLLHILLNTGLPLSIVHAVPAGQLQSGNPHRSADSEPNLLRVRSAAGHIQAAAPGCILTADLGNGQNIPPVVKRPHFLQPLVCLGVILTGVDGDSLPAGDRGIDSDLTSRSGSHAQGLQLTAALAVLRAVQSTAAGIQTDMNAAAGRLAVKKGLRQIQLVGHVGGIEVVISLIAVQPLTQGVDLRLGDAGKQLRMQAVHSPRKEAGDLLLQAAGRIVLQEHQL